jgi:DNA repair protein RadD
VEAGIISAGYETSPGLPVQVASVQTLIRRINRGDDFPAFDLLVVDECHHSTSPTYRTIFEHQPNAKLLGVSATPSRLDGRGLGEVYDAIVCGPSIKELTSLGYLSPIRLFTADQDIDLRGVQSQRGDYVTGDLVKAIRKAKITGDAVEQYRTHADHRPVIAFGVTVEHCEEVAKQFRDAGYKAACVHGGTPKTDRDALIEGLGTGEIEVLLTSR